MQADQSKKRAPKRPRRGVRFEAGEQDALAHSLRDEIELLRELMRQAGEKLTEDDAPDRSLQELLKILDSLSLSGSRLAALVKAQKQLEGDQPAASGLAKALSEVLKERSENSLEG